MPSRDGSGFIVGVNTLGMVKDDGGHNISVTSLGGEGHSTLLYCHHTNKVIIRKHLNPIEFTNHVTTWEQCEPNVRPHTFAILAPLQKDTALKHLKKGEKSWGNSLCGHTIEMGGSKWRAGRFFKNGKCRVYNATTKKSAIIAVDEFDVLIWQPCKMLEQGANTSTWKVSVCGEVFYRTKDEILVVQPPQFGEWRSEAEVAAVMAVEVATTAATAAATIVDDCCF